VELTAPGPRPEMAFTSRRGVIGITLSDYECRTRPQNRLQAF